MLPLNIKNKSYNANTLKNKLAYGWVDEAVINSWEELQNASPVEIYKYLPIFIRITPFIDYLGQILENERGEKAVGTPLNAVWKDQQIFNNKSRFPDFGIDNFDLELQGLYSSLFRTTLNITLYNADILNDDMNSITMLTKFGTMAKIEVGRSNKRWEYIKPESAYDEPKFHSGNGMELLGKVTAVSMNFDEKGIGKLNVTLTSASVPLMKLFNSSKMFNINSEKAKKLFEDSKYNKEFTYEKPATRGDKLFNSIMNVLSPNDITTRLKFGRGQTKWVTDVEKDQKRVVEKTVGSAISLKDLFEEILPQLIESNMKNYFLLNIINADIAKIETSALLDKSSVSLSPSASQYVGLPNSPNKEKWSVGDICIEKQSLLKILKNDYSDFEELVNAILDFIRMQIIGLDLTLIVHSNPAISVIVQEGNYFNEEKIPTTAEELRNNQYRMLPIEYGGKNNIIKTLTFDTDLQEAKNIQNYLELESVSLATPKDVALGVYMSMNSKFADKKFFDEFKAKYGATLVQDNILQNINKWKENPTANYLWFTSQEKQKEGAGLAEEQNIDNALNEQIKTQLKQAWNSRIFAPGVKLFPYKLEIECIGISEIWYGTCVHIKKNRIPALNDSLWKITNIKHTISKSGWFTSFGGVCILTKDSEQRTKYLDAQFNDILKI